MNENATPQKETKRSGEPQVMTVIADTLVHVALMLP